ncbi:glycosyltransferase family 2 protein [Pseudomonas sp. RIT-PI-S]|uniref:glycosyltransferase family 2 protein n=1 Tax=Pseudomonas sp. RIT-PI-S TaxID=3035295 RepID=UPI0021DAA398|nr:glycosyltransferase family 2 protein [Pseudomonas sp. RIT-PI-S]
MGPSPLVSIVIPAYKAAFFEVALRSAFAQDYPAIEIIIGDDCATTAISDIVERLRGESPWPIDYLRNPVQLREAPNVTSCVRRAKGKYVKFLYDDDVLAPHCVRRLVETLESYPGLALATARRMLIDEDGLPLPDIYATRFPFTESMRIHGPDLTSFFGEYTYNFVGEPTSVLCRRADLIDFGDSIFGLDGQHIDWVGDLAIWVKLMRRGDLAMLDETLSQFRVSSQQFSQGGRDDTSGPRAYHALFRRLLNELGWVRPQAQNTHVRCAPLAVAKAGEPGQPFDLCAWLHEVLPGYAQPDFKRWWQARQLGPARQAKIDAHASAHGGGPAVLLVINDLANDEARLLQTLHSLDRQAPLLANTTVVVLSSRPNVGSGQVEERFYWVSSQQNLRAAHLNQLISELSFDWLLSVDAGTRINADALSVTFLELMGNPACPAIFCDEVYSDGHGGLWPLLRGNFNLDQLLSVPLAMAGHWLFRRDALTAMDGFDGSLPAALELDMILRLIEAGQHGFGHISEALVTLDARPLQPCADERRALLQHLQRRGYSHAQVAEPSNRHYHLDYGHLGEGQVSPTVAVLVPAQGPLEILKRCVSSALMLTGYTNFQVVLVETERTTEPLGEWMDELAGEAHGRVLAVRSPRPLGVNTAINGAVEALNHDFITLLDPACVVVEERWLELMLDQALRPEVGAVGARRVERGERLLDAGLRLGLEGPAETALLRREEGPVEYVQVQRNVVALSAACLMMSRAIFRQVGGFDDERFGQRWADVDLCLKLHWAGYLNVWTPRAWVAQTEPVRPASSGTDAGLLALDEAAMYAQWGASLGRDPCASHLYAQRGNGFDFDPDPQALWRPLAFAGLPVVVGGGAPGSADPRIVQPLEALRASGLLEGGLTPHALRVSEWLRLVPGSVVLPLGATVADFGLDAARAGQLAPCRICDLASAADSQLEPAALNQALAGFDKVLVATPEQAERVAGAHPRIEVLPTRLAPLLWADLPQPEKASARVRAGLVCDDLHSLDSTLLAGLLEQFAGRVHWVVIGQLPPSLRPWVDEFHPAVAPHRYPSQLAQLSLHVAVVAVADGFSQLALAEQRVLEHGACGAAVISNRPSAWPVASAGPDLEAVSAALQAWLDAPEQREGAASKLHAEVMARGLIQGEQAERWLAAWGPLMD